MDPAILPEPAFSLLKPASWAAKNRSIDPVAIPRSKLSIETDAHGRRNVSIPDEFGGGRVVERPHAIRGRANEASPGEQRRALGGFFSNLRGHR